MTCWEINAGAVNRLKPKNSNRLRLIANLSAINTNQSGYPMLGNQTVAETLLAEWLIELLKKQGEVEIMADVLVDVKISVAPGEPPPEPLAVDASGVPAAATVGIPYSGKLVASGGSGNYSFSDVSAQQTPPGTGLPSGVVLNADGTISGTPTVAGDFDATFDVSDGTAAASARVRVAANRR